MNEVVVDDRQARAEKRMLAALIQMMMEFPFWGHIAATLRLYYCDREPWLNTAATDGENMWFDIDFVLKCDVLTLVWVLAHESAHAVCQHSGDFLWMEPDYRACALDFWINHLINNFKGPRTHQLGIGTPPKFITPLYDKTLTSEMTIEEIYHELKRRGPAPGTSFDYHSKPLAGGEASTITGPISGTSSRIYPDHKTPEEPEPAPPDLTEEEIEKRRIGSMGIIMRASASAGSQHCPIQFRKMVDQFTESKVNWKEELQAYLLSAQKNDVTMMAFDESCWWTEVILPGPDDDDDGVDIAIAIDTSGSVNENMLRQFLSEVKQITVVFREFKLSIWCFSTSVTNFKVFTPENINELEEYSISERGGTNFEAIFDFMANKKYVPDRLLVFTDGYPNGSWGNPVYCPTMFVIAGAKHIVAPFGRTIYFPI